MAFCHLEVVGRDDIPDSLDWIYWLEPDGKLRILVARDASIDWSRREALTIIGGVVRTIVLGRGEGRARATS